MTMSEMVSIISPCYNGEKYLDNYLKSVLNQTYDNIELIVIDDASTDKTASILESYEPEFQKKGYQFIHMTLATNSGQAAAVNRGLKLFSGEYVTWMDSDDIYYPDAIQKKVEFLKRHKEFDFVLNYGEIVNETDLNHQLGILKRTKPIGKDELFKDLLDESNVVFGPGTILVKTESLKKAIPDLDIYESREGQNWQLMLPLAYCCSVGYLDEVLFKYVVHTDSHSHTKRTLEQEYKRRDNFYKLQCETIDKIGTMQRNEKEYWKNYALTRSILTKYRMAIYYHNFLESVKKQSELKERGVKILWKDGFLSHHFRIITRRIKEIVG